MGYRFPPDVLNIQSLYILEAHEQYSIVDILFNYVFYFGPTGQTSLFALFVCMFLFVSFAFLLLCAVMDVPAWSTAHAPEWGVFLACPWISLDLRGSPCISLDFLGFPRTSMDFYGFPRISVVPHALIWISNDVRGFL